MKSFSILPPILEIPRSAKSSNKSFISPGVKQKKKKRKLPNPLVKDDLCLDLRHNLKPERSESVNRIDDLNATEGKLRFFQTKLLKKIRKIRGNLRVLLKEYYENLIETKNQQKDLKQKKERFIKDMQDEKKKRTLGPWDLLWEYKQEVLKRDSPYADFPSYRIRQLIVKGGDDLRQEMVAMQIMGKVKDIFALEKTQLYVHCYEIIAIDSNSGVLEFISDSISLDGLKKKYTGCSLKEIYQSIFTANFEEAQKNFIESLAAYSVITYLLKIKDRHNGNIMMNSKGHLIHIDFGFILTTGPNVAGVIFEIAPFKMTKDYMTMIGEENSSVHTYFQILLVKGFVAVRKHMDEICDLLEIMHKQSPLPCFEKFDLHAFRESMKPSLKDEQVGPWVKSLFEDSLSSMRTAWYDDFQRMSNGIEP